MSTTTHTLLTLTVAILLLVSYQFIGAQSWTVAPSSPPNNNVSAPINTSASPQTKFGPFTVATLTATSVINGTADINMTGSIGVSGQITADGNAMLINGAMPNLILSDNDTGMRDMRIRNNDNRLLFITQRTPTDVVMLDLNATGPTGSEYAAFSGDVRAQNLCTQNGQACARTIDVANVVNRYATTSSITCDDVSFTAGGWGGIAGKELELSNAEETTHGLNTANRYNVSGESVSRRCQQLGYEFGVSELVFASFGGSNPNGWCGYSNARTVIWARNSSGVERWIDVGCFDRETVARAQCCTIN